MGDVIRVLKFHQTDRRIQSRYIGGVKNVVVLPVEYRTPRLTLRETSAALAKKYGAGSVAPILPPCDC